MTPTRHRFRKARAPRATATVNKAGGNLAGKGTRDMRDTSRPKATTFRLDPALQARLIMLARVLKQPLNRLVNEAVRGFVERRSAEVEADLERTLEHLRAYRQKDPHFESAIAQLVEAEASLERDDPIEGRPRPTAGPAQTMVHELLRG